MPWEPCPGAGRGFEIKVRLLIDNERITVNIEGKDWGGLRASDPYWTLSRQSAPGQWQPVHKSEFIKKSSNPSW